jgi:LAO/AO transport system kinase
MLLCEAAGFDVVLVETVGAGQSETAVADLTDFFLVLMLPGAGYELQGLKKGVIELADMIAVNKADGDNAGRASAAAAEYRAALQILTPASATWSPPVLTVSGLAGQGLDSLWAKILDHRGRLAATGELARKRREQDAKWMWALVDERLHQRLTGDASHRERMRRIEQAVAKGEISPTAGADDIAQLLGL